MKIAVVVQRYGTDINGGAELHARFIAERLARHVAVDVLTTCARDYITWRNDLPATTDAVNGVTVRRFPVDRERDPEDFGQRSRLVFRETHALRDELAWLESEGPASGALITFIQAHAADYDFFLFFSFRYYHAWHGARAVPGKAILVPTAERDGALGLAMFAPIFRGVRALMYNSLEERRLIQAVSGNQAVPSVVVGVGSEIPAQTSPGRFRQKFGRRERFALYVGRIDENKGCAELFAFFQRYARELQEGLHLVLIGHPVIPIPDHPRIHHLGYVSDQDKFDALAAAELLVMPSYFESLSMVALEAWALGKPVLVNGRCDVLRGQTVRSNGGLYYETFEEFLETLRTLDTSRTLASTLGRNGQAYFERHYTWPVIEAKYLAMFEQLAQQPPTHTMEPLPGWFSRRRRSLPPAGPIVDALLTGAVLEREEVGPALPSVARPAALRREPRADATVDRQSEPPPADRPRRPLESKASGDRPARAGRPRQAARRPAAGDDATARSHPPRRRGARGRRPRRPDGK